MKKTLVFLVAIAACFAACKKDNNNQSDENPVIQQEYHTKNAEPYSYGLQSKFLMSDGNALYRYGSFDASGNLEIPSFLMMELKDHSDKIVVTVLDETGDLAYMYETDKNSSAKSSSLVEYIAPTANELIVNLYNYDWTTNEGTLVKSVRHLIGADKKVTTETLALRTTKGKIERLDQLMQYHEHNRWSADKVRTKLKTTSGAHKAWVALTTIQTFGGLALVVGGGIIFAKAPVIAVAVGVFGAYNFVKGGQDLNWDFIKKMTDFIIPSSQAADLDPSTYQYQQQSLPGANNVLPVGFDPVQSAFAEISMYDYGTIDNDIISIIVNNVSYGTFTLTASPQTVNVPLIMGANNIRIVPQSEGSIPPCTPSVTITADGISQTKTISGYVGSSTTASIIRKN